MKQYLQLRLVFLFMIIFSCGFFVLFKNDIIFMILTLGGIILGVVGVIVTYLPEENHKPQVKGNT